MFNDLAQELERITLVQRLTGGAETEETLQMSTEKLRAIVERKQLLGILTGGEENNTTINMTNAMLEELVVIVMNEMEVLDRYYNQH